MKPRPSLRHSLGLAVGCSLLAISSASAADGTYISQNNVWNFEDSWQDGIIADGADFTASFTNDVVTSNRTTSLGANRTIGHIVFTDGNISTPFNRTIGNTGVLTLDVTTGAPTIDVTQTLRYLTISSQISGDKGLTKKGIGILVLDSSSNNFTGTIKVEAGRFQVDQNIYLGSNNNNIVVDSGGTFYASGTSLTYTRAGTTSISGLGWVESDTESTAFGALRVGTRFLNTDSTSTYTGNITLTGNARIGAAAYVNTTTTNTLSGKITGSFGVDFFGATTYGASTNGTITHIISNTTNDYTGNTTITNGAYNSASTVSRTNLRLGANNVIPNGASAGNVVFALHGTNSTSTVALDLRGRNETINGLTVNPGSVPFTSRITNGSTTAASVLTIGDNNTSSAFSGIIEDSHATNNLGITKIGAGTLTLSGANTYRGATNVNAGTLKLATAGSLANGTSVSIAAAATLDLTEKTAASATYSWNTAFLNASGAATVATISGTAGGTIDMGTKPISLTTDAVSPSLTVTGARLALGGNTLTVVVPGAALTAGVYTLVSAASITGTVNPTPSYNGGNGLVSGGAGVVSISGNTVILTVTSTQYNTWATSKGLTGAPGSSTDPAKDADPDKDGRNNLAEFAFNGDPLSGADNGKVFVLTADSDFDGETANKELILTVAVRTGTLAFSGSPSPTAIQAADGITYRIEGSLDLSGFLTTVNVVPTAIPPLSMPLAGAGYEYRSFSLSGSNGLTGKGFLRAKVTSP